MYVCVCICMYMYVYVCICTYVYVPAGLRPAVSGGRAGGRAAEKRKTEESPELSID